MNVICWMKVLYKFCLQIHLKRKKQYYRVGWETATHWDRRELLLPPWKEHLELSHTYIHQSAPLQDLYPSSPALRVWDMDRHQDHSKASWCLRYLVFVECGKSYGYHTPGTLQSTNETARSITGCLPVSEKVKSYRLMFFRHLASSAPEEDHHRVIAASLRPPTNWRRPVGRPRTTWLRTVDEDVQPQNFGVEVCTGTGLQSHTQPSPRSLNPSSSAPTSIWIHPHPFPHHFVSAPPVPTDWFVDQ